MRLSDEDAADRIIGTRRNVQGSKLIYCAN
jgi:hypothetical protein